MEVCKLHALGSCHDVVQQIIHVMMTQRHWQYSAIRLATFSYLKLPLGITDEPNDPVCCV